MTPQPLVDNLSPPDPARLVQSIKSWGREPGFQQVGISDVEPGEYEVHLQYWLEAGCHGEMDYMAAHGSERSRPTELVSDTLRVTPLYVDYLPNDTRMAQVLATPGKTCVSHYALGHDYHKLIRKCLQQLAERIQAEVGPLGFCAFVDSAPMLEKATAEQTGLGWIGRNTLVLNRRAGSYFFLGELFVDMPLPISPAMDSEHCECCSACLDICSTAAFVGPHQLDTRRCVFYLTIEYKGAIPPELRLLIGNRVFGYDDCQIVYPQNRFAYPTGQGDFQPRHSLDNAELAELFLWSEEEFLSRVEGPLLYRAGYERWLRNLTVGLGNAPSTIPVLEALRVRRGFPSELACRYAEWTLRRHGGTQPSRHLSPDPDGSGLDEMVATVAQLGGRLADIVQRQVGVALPEALVDLRRPTHSRLLEGGNVEVAAAEVASRPGYAPIEEVAVLADTVAANQRAVLGHLLLEEGQGLRLNLGHTYGTFPNPLGQAGLTVLAGIPLVHVDGDFLWLADGDHRFFGQNAGVIVGDDGGHLGDDVPVWTEAGHLQVDLDKVLRALYGESLQSLCRVL